MLKHHKFSVTKNLWAISSLKGTRGGRLVEIIIYPKSITAAFLAGNALPSTNKRASAYRTVGFNAE